MKNILFALAVPLLAGCSAEEFSSTSGLASFSKSALDDAEAANPANPYDSAGQHYLDLSDAFGALADVPVQDAEIISSAENLAWTMPLAMGGYNTAVSQNIKALRDLGNANPSAAFLGVPTSLAFRTQLQDGIASLALLKNSDAGFGEVYTLLLACETSALNSGLSQKEKEALLSTYSIIRYSLYNSSRRKRKDRDWELLVGNYAGIAYGAAESTANAIVAALLCETLSH